MVPGSNFDLDCRIRHPKRKTAVNGSQYLAFVIEDCSCALKAYAWQEQCDISIAVHDLDRVKLGGKIREFDGSSFATIQYIEAVKESQGAIKLIPRCGFRRKATTIPL
jgi:putative lipase involved disintegration of autophagic bodies